MQQPPAAHELAAQHESPPPPHAAHSPSPPPAALHTRPVWQVLPGQQIWPAVVPHVVHLFATHAKPLAHSALPPPAQHAWPSPPHPASTPMLPSELPSVVGASSPLAGPSV